MNFFEVLKRTESTWRTFLRKPFRQRTRRRARMLWRDASALCGAAALVLCLVVLSERGEFSVGVDRRELIQRVVRVCPRCDIDEGDAVALSSRQTGASLHTVRARDQLLASLPEETEGHVGLLFDTPLQTPPSPKNSSSPSNLLFCKLWLLRTGTKMHTRFETLAYFSNQKSRAIPLALHL